MTKNGILYPVLLIVVAAALLFQGCVVRFVETGPVTPTPTPVATATVTPAPRTPPPTSPTPLTTLPNLTQLVERVKPAVASIVVQTVTLNFFLQPVPTTGAGSGVIIDPRGYIVTNNHVVEDARVIQVSLPDGRIFDGTLVGRDPLSDLAVVKVDGKDLPTATLGDSTTLNVGEWVVAIGNALALEGGPTVTAGVVSATGRSILLESGVTLHDMIQTDAAINPGNSGGPLINLNGEVVGINTAIASQAQGIGFSISTSTAKAIIRDLIDKGRVVRPAIGITGDSVTAVIKEQYNLSVDKGVVVATVAPGSGAEKSGLRPGDVITKLAGQEVDSIPKLQYILWQYNVGDEIEVTFVRDNKERTLKVKLVERSS